MLDHKIKDAESDLLQFECVNRQNSNACWAGCRGRCLGDASYPGSASLGPCSEVPSWSRPRRCAMGEVVGSRRTSRPCGRKGLCSSGCKVHCSLGPRWDVVVASNRRGGLPGQCWREGTTLRTSYWRQRKQSTEEGQDKTRQDETEAGIVIRSKA
jgi:hypothetical protein